MITIDQYREDLRLAEDLLRALVDAADATAQALAGIDRRADEARRRVVSLQQLISSPEDADEA